MTGSALDLDICHDILRLELKGLTLWCARYGFLMNKIPVFVAIWILTNLDTYAIVI